MLYDLHDLPQLVPGQLVDVQGQLPLLVVRHRGGLLLVALNGNRQSRCFTRLLGFTALTLVALSADTAAIFLLLTLVLGSEIVIIKRASYTRYFL